MKQNKVSLALLIAFGLFLFGGIAHAVTIAVPFLGGTGTNVIPSYGQILVGNGSGVYTPVATSTLGITAGAGGSLGQLQWNSGGALAGISTTTVTCAGSAVCNPFVILGASPITITASGGSGGSGMATSSPDYVIATAGGTVYAYDHTGALVTSASNASTVLGTVVAAASATGASIAFKSGTYYLTATTTLPGTTDAAGITWKIWGAGQSATNLVVNNNADAFFLQGSVKADIRNLSIYLKGSANGITANSNGSGYRSVWNSVFESLMLTSTTTDSTGWGINFSNDFRNSYNNIQFLSLGNCLRSSTESVNLFNPGDSVYQNMMCDLSGNTTTEQRYAYYFDGSSGVKQVNQDTFTDVNAFSNTGNTTAWYLNHTKWFTAKAINSEGFATTTELYNDSDTNNFEFEYNIGSTTPSTYFSTDSTSAANTFSCRYVSSYPGTHVLLRDSNTDDDFPNIVQGVSGGTCGTYGSGTFTFATTSATLVRDFQNRGSNALDLVKNAGDRLVLNFANGATQFIQSIASRLGFFNASSSPAMIIDNSNKIGIGTTTPSYRLHINNDSSVGQVGISGAGNTFNYSQLILGTANFNKTWNLQHRQTAAELDNFSIEEYDGSAFNSRLTIKPGGNVGIGTTSPPEKLSIRCSTGYCTNRIDSGVVSGYLSVNDIFPSVNVGSNSNHPLNFIVNNLPAGSFDTSGRLVIGNSPKFYLQNNVFGGYLNMQSDGTGDNGEDTIVVVQAPAAQPQEADVALRRESPTNSNNSEFSDLDEECYGTPTLLNTNCYDHFASWVIAKRGTGQLRPWALRFWNQDLGDVAGNGFMGLVVDPGTTTATKPTLALPSVAIGNYASSTSGAANRYDPTIALQVLSTSTAASSFAVETTPRTADLFLVKGNGRTGIGTSTPGSLLSLNNLANFTTATSTFYTTGGINLAGGCFAVNGTCITGGSSSASSTLFSISNTLWLSALGTPAGSILAVDSNGKVIATTTSAGGVSAVNGTYPVQSSGGATPSISLAFGTTTDNTWNGANLFLASTTIGTGAQAGGLTISGGATTTGNVNIKGSPTGAALRVNGTADFGNNIFVNASNQGLWFNTFNQFTHGILKDTSNSVNIRTNSIDRLFVNNGGNIGVGTSTAWGKLAINLNNGDTNPYAFTIASSTAAATTTLFQVSNTGSTTIASTLNVPTICLSSDCKSAWPTGSGGDAITADDANNTLAIWGSTEGDPKILGHDSDVYMSTGAYGHTINAPQFEAADAITSPGYLVSNTFSWNSLLSIDNNGLIVATSTPTAGYFISTSTSKASTFPFASSTALSATTVCLTGDTCRTTWPSGGSSVWPWTTATTFSTTTNATTTGAWFQQGLYASSTSQFVNTNIWGNLRLMATSSALLATDSAGNVIATTSVATNFLTGLLATINGTAVTAGGSPTITAASSTLLANNNTWSGLNTFSLLRLTATSSALLATDASGNVIATTSIGTNLLTGALGSINGTSLTRGGSITVSAASSTLLADNNTFSTSGTTTITGAVLVGLPSAAITPENKLSVIGNANDYHGIFVQNLNGGSTASTDIVAGNDNLDANAYVDMGTNSTGNTNPSFTLFGKGDAYLFSQVALGNLVIANASSTKSIIFGTGGLLSANERMRITGTGNVGIGTTSPGSLLSIGSVANILSSGTSTWYQPIQFIGNFSSGVASSTSQAASVTINWNSGGDTFRHILTQNTTLNFNATSSNPLDGGRYTIDLCQDGVGSRTVTFVNQGQIIWQSGTTTVASSANSNTELFLYYKGNIGRYLVQASSTNADPKSCIQ